MLNAKNVGYLSVWLLLMTAVVGYGIRMPITMAVLVGGVTVILVSLISRNRLLERFENESASEEAMEKKKESPEAHSSDPHLDVGSTILHAYRTLRLGVADVRPLQPPGACNAELCSHETLQRIDRPF